MEQQIQANPLSVTISTIANINEAVIEELSSVDSNTFRIETGTFTAHELIALLNLKLRSFQLEASHDFVGNPFQSKYKCVLPDQSLSHSEPPSLRLNRQMAFMLGFLPYHLATKEYTKDNFITIRILFNRVYYMDACSHLTTLSLESSANTFNFNKIARVSIIDKVQGLILGDLPFATFELNKNWNAITIKNPYLHGCKIHLMDMLNCKVSMTFLEVVIDFNNILILN